MWGKEGDGDGPDRAPRIAFLAIRPSGLARPAGAKNFWAGAALLRPSPLLVVTTSVLRNKAHTFSKRILNIKVKKQNLVTEKRGVSQCFHFVLVLLEDDSLTGWKGVPAVMRRDWGRPIMLCIDSCLGDRLLTCTTGEDVRGQVFESD
jgi:hypothetical protein